MIALPEGTLGPEPLGREPTNQRMFRIHRYFAIASAIVILAAMVLVGTLYHHQAVKDLADLAQGHNVALARTLSNTVWSRFSPYLTSVSGSTGDELRARPETEKIDHLLRRLTEGLSILKIKIYSPDGLTIYSSEHAQIGEVRGDKSGTLRAIRESKPQSALSYKDRVSAFSGELFNRDVMETYVPVKSENGDIIGIFEIYSDVTEMKDTIDHAIFSMVLGISLVFVLLYGTLVFVVLRYAIAPLHLASQRAAAIGPRTSGVRLPTDGMPSEVLPLIEAMNGALDRLDKALDAQRQFTADAAHELLTPLAVVTASLDTIEDKKIAAELRADVGAMSELVTKLLELAEIDALNPEEDELVNIRDACLEVISMMAPLAYGQNKTISLTGSKTTFKVRCCANTLTRALRNLVENAIVHTPANTSVEVNLQEDGAICVIDNGPGVPRAVRDLIFQRFWRGDAKHRPGAGLGLSIVKRFVDAYGGKVEVNDAPGGGGVFTIRLPIVETHSRSPRPLAEATSNSRTSPGTA